MTFCSSMGQFYGLFFGFNSTPAPEDPERENPQNQGEAECQIFQRSAGEARPQDLVTVIHHDIARGQPPIGEELKGKDDRVRGPECFSGEQFGAHNKEVKYCCAGNG